MTPEPPNDGNPAAPPGPPGPPGKQKRVLVGEKIERPIGGEATFADAVKTIKAGDFFNVAGNNCANRGFQNGVIFGAVVGAFRIIVMRGRPLAGGNWAVASGVTGAVVTHQLCLYASRREKEVMRKTVEVSYDRARAQAAAKAEAKAAAAAQEGVAPGKTLETESATQSTSSTSKPWYRLW